VGTDKNVGQTMYFASNMNEKCKGAETFLMPLLL